MLGCGLLLHSRQQRIFLFLFSKTDYLATCANSFALDESPKNYYAGDSPQYTGDSPQYMGRGLAAIHMGLAAIHRGLAAIQDFPLVTMYYLVLPQDLRQ